MLNRLGVLLLWAGFVSLVSFYGVAVITFLTRSETAVELGKMMIEDISYLAQIPPPSENGLQVIWFWLAHLYWPVRWITTGNKSPLPWVANKETEQ